MTAQQEKAIQALERAFKQCHEAGLVIQGMDENLLAFDAAELREAESRGLNRHNAMGEVDSVTIYAEAYSDSGGW